MTQNEILDALEGPRFGSLPMTDKTDAIDGILKYLYALRGYTVADNIQAEIDTATSMLEYKLSHSFAHLTVAEIKLALEQGIIGYFTKDKRLTIANYLEWLTKYSTSQERAEAVEARVARQKQLSQSQAGALLPEADLARLNEDAGRRSALREFDNFCKSGKLDFVCQGYGAMIYDFLIQRGCFNPNDATIRAAYKRSKNHLRGGVRTRGILQQLGSVIVDFNPERAMAAQLLDYSTKCELLAMFFSTLKARKMPLNV